MWVTKNYKWLCLIILLFFRADTFGQSGQNWGLTYNNGFGYFFIQSSHYLASTAKFGPSGRMSLMYTNMNYAPNVRLTINQLNADDYVNWYGANFNVINTFSSSGVYNYISFSGSSSCYVRDFEIDANDNHIFIADNQGDGWDPITTANSNLNDSTQLLIGKINISNQVLWHHTYGGSSAEHAISIRIAADGNYIVLAETQSSDGDISDFHGGKDIWLLKINYADGSIIWKKTIGTVGDERPTDMEILADGSILISGSATQSASFPSVYSGTNAFLLKADAVGNVTWIKTFGGNGDETINRFDIIPNSGFISIIKTNSSNGEFNLNAGGTDVYICRHNNVGDIIWKKHYGFTDNDEAGDIAFSSCDSSSYISFTKEFVGTPWPFTQFPAYSQNCGVRVVLDANGIERFFLQDLFWLPLNFSNNNITPSIVSDHQGGILCSGISHVTEANPNRTLRGVGGGYYKPTLRTQSFDTTICHGQVVFGNLFLQDSTFSDTLRNFCNIDTLITNYQVDVINADSIYISHDTTVCKGSLFNGNIITEDLVSSDTTTAPTVCGDKLIITQEVVRVATPILNNFGKDTTICPNTTLVLAAYSPAQSYIWQDQSAASTFTTNNEGIYWVEVTDGYGCKAKDTIMVYKNDLYLQIPGNLQVQPQQSVTLSPQTNGVVTWQANPTLNCTNCQSAVATPAATTTYYLNSTKDGCTLQANITLKINKDLYLYIPGAFTPNSDTQNDKFKVITNITGYFYLEIRNRFGERVFSTYDSNVGWDGKFLRQDQPMETYVYFVQYRDKSNEMHTKKGSVLLIR